VDIKRWRIKALDRVEWASIIKKPRPNWKGHSATGRRRRNACRQIIIYRHAFQTPIGETLVSALLCAVFLLCFYMQAGLTKEEKNLNCLCTLHLLSFFMKSNYLFSTMDTCTQSNVWGAFFQKAISLADTKKKVTNGIIYSTRPCTFGISCLIRRAARLILRATEK
jgi:hypothetical protein